ncbi:divalent metal cation transporter [Alicyclobacillus fastidiosus]|uniref:Divalent metal cation transporter n=1 Tax=Alicyclobacillus fastidiosus TaxID=392011 RepID=A0ABY6ZKP5_9BACL|nr:divalent metal cation transporter [Alicyclobacillus fastidiosus]WAH42470.1 divalent metal cation transporter [Alicyclobacillus fastidiosus]WAH42493.1 divalent metal cation transporter [Alicyclobacillus fastidiosus]GMA64303.1 hypothetical protein GCM10025859_47430 [Alicyclobacillus fastidiosus]GMA64332.1 hypothetical protein GCM10025859_47720 [Alicyclobacillus fastidiosus]
MLAVGVIGATVMPHVVYLHSGLTQKRVVLRNNEEKILVNRFSTKEVIIALDVNPTGTLVMTQVTLSMVLPI